MLAAVQGLIIALAATAGLSSRLFEHEQWQVFDSVPCACSRLVQDKLRRQLVLQHSGLRSLLALSSNTSGAVQGTPQRHVVPWAARFLSSQFNLQPDCLFFWHAQKMLFHGQRAVCSRAFPLLLLGCCFRGGAERGCQPGARRR